MVERNTFVGLDVHKDSIAVALAERGRFGEVRYYGTVGGDMDGVDRLLRDLRAPGRTMHFVYEAGPCGFQIFRHLTTRVENCAVVSPSLTPTPPGDRAKTDRRDAEILARPHRAATLLAIDVPDRRL